MSAIASARPAASARLPVAATVTVDDPDCRSPPRGDALVPGVEHDEHARGVEPLGHGRRDLLAEPLLQLRARGHGVEDAGQGAEADELLPRCVRQVRDPDEGQQVVLAHRAEPDLADDHELAALAVLGVHGAVPGDRGRVDPDAGENSA